MNNGMKSCPRLPVIIAARLSTAIVLACAIPSVSQAKTLIRTIEDLQAMSQNLAGDYVLASDIDASATSSWNGGAGFLPVGSNSTAPFSGTFNGGGHTISNLYINSQGNAAGLFGFVGSSGVVENINLTAGSVAIGSTAYAPAGALVGDNEGLVSGATASVTIAGNGNQDESAGGLIGINESIGIITGSNASGTVSGADSGGLVGDNFGAISKSYATGAVNGGTGGYRSAGGFAGSNYGSIEMSFSTGNVTGTDGIIGGFVGLAYGSITNAYATGSVNGSEDLANNEFEAGGFAGLNSGVLTAVYSIGRAQAPGYAGVGGLVGNDTNGSTTGTVVHGYWDVSTSHLKSSAGGTAETTAKLQSALPKGFSARIWAIVPNSSFPYLIGVGTPP